MKISQPLILATVFLAKISFSQCTFTAGISVSTASGCGSPTLTLNNSEADGIWSQKASFTGGRWQAVGFSIGNKGYIGTGVVSFSATGLNDFWEYDPLTDVWTQKANVGGLPRRGAVGFSIGNKGYVGTGYTSASSGSNDFWEYDPTTNTWTQKANAGTAARKSAFGFTLNNKGYIGTGSATNALNDVWEYDPASDTWTQKNNFAGPGRTTASVFTIGNKAYVGTGTANNGAPLSDFWEFDPLSDTWTQKTNFAGGPVRSALGLNIGTKGYLCTGFKNGNYSDLFWEYDPSTDNWNQKAHFPGIIREGATGFVIGGKAYVGSGYSYTSGMINFDDLWQYDPTVNISWSNGSTQQSFVAPANGTYSATVTDQSGCSVLVSQAVTLNTPLISISGPTAICAGSAANLTANGAATYSWSANTGNPGSANVSVSPSTVTSYTVNGTSALGCHGTPVIITVSVLPSFSVNITGPSAICEGKSTTLSASGATTYSWSNGATGSSISVTPTIGTVYSVNTEGSSLCGGSASRSITVNAAPVLNTNHSNILLCPGTSVTLTAYGANLYIWSTGDVSASTVIHPMATTVYTLTGLSTAGCSKTATVTQIVAECTGIANTASNDYSFSVYPNPGNGLVNIRSSALPKNATVELYNYTGQLIISQNLDNNTQLNIESTANGMYTLRISAGNKILYAGKIIRQ